VRRILAATALAGVLGLAVGWYYVAHRPAAGPELASDQTLRLALSADVETLDPAQLRQPSVGYSMARNVFGGLYKLDAALRTVPDLAAGPPAVSADGLTWTFKLKPNALFSNGDPVHARDFIYSWSRTASFPTGDATLFDPVAGFAAVQAGTSGTLAGLSAPDEQTLVARLTQPAGFWYAELAHPAASVIDEKVVKARGETGWWSTPQGLVGTGPFEMVARDPGRSLDFEPVPHWWGGGNGSLHVHAEVVGSARDQVRAYEQGKFDIVGYAPENTAPSLDPADLLRYRGQEQLVSRPWLKSEFVLFNFSRGGFSSVAGDLPARQAFSRGIDRQVLAANWCQQGTTCQPATGGLIPKGLAGYLGDGADSTAVFTPAAAKQALAVWDPTGSRRQGLTLTAAPGFEGLARELARQWKANLDVDVAVTAPDASAFRAIRGQRLFTFVVGGFVYDYNSPHDWLPELFRNGLTGYHNVAFDSLLAKADAELDPAAAADYAKAGTMLLDDAAYIALDYPLGIYLVKPYVRGAGGNAVDEYAWSGITIARH